MNKTINTTYKSLVNILKRDGAQFIELPLKDMLPFIRYTSEQKFTKRLYYEIKRGKFKVSTYPINIKQQQQNVPSL